MVSKEKEIEYNIQQEDQMQYIIPLLIGILLSGTVSAHDGSTPLFRAKRMTEEEIKAAIAKEKEENREAARERGIVRQQGMPAAEMKDNIGSTDLFELWKKIHAGELINDDKEKFEEHFTYGEKAHEFANAANYEAPIHPLRIKHFPFRPYGFQNKKQTSNWKIHVTSDPGRANLIARLVVPVLMHLKVDFKVIENHDFVQRFEKDETQRGKFITIYPTGYPQAKMLIQGLEKLFEEAVKSVDFKDLTHPPRPLLGDAKVGKSGYVFLRYGAHESSQQVTVLNPGGKRMRAEFVGDARTFPFPEFVWHLESNAIKGDKIFFEGTPLTWTIPGTDYIIYLNDPKHLYHSWKDVVHLLRSQALPPHVKDHKQFERVTRLLEYAVEEHQQRAIGR